MKGVSLFVAVLCTVQSLYAEEVRLLNLDPPEAQQHIENHDQSLHYAAKVESNVPAIRYLGNEPHNVLEDIYLARQYHGQDGLGGYLYGYNIPDIAKTEKKNAGGDLRGAYNYKNNNGQEIKVQYWDDGTGFHQIDNVPKILPKQIDDLPEVKAEKERFLARWHEEAERNQRPVQSPYDSDGNYASGPLSPQGQLEFKKLVASQPQPQYQPGSSGIYQQYQPSGQYQPGQYQQAGQYQQPGQYQQGGQYQQPGQYQAGQYQQPGQYQQTGQYQQPGQYQQNQYQQPGQYQQIQQSGQYQQPGQPQHSGQYQGAGQYQPGQNGENQIDYTGAYSENQNSYVSSNQLKPDVLQSSASSQYSQQSQYQSPGNYQQGGQYQQSGQHQEDGQYRPSEHESAGQYDKKYDEEEGVTGPPKGFFYSFDYPVGEIVQKGEIARIGDLKNAYNDNKAKYESQLSAGHSGSPAAQNSYAYGS